MEGPPGGRRSGAAAAAGQRERAAGSRRGEATSRLIALPLLQQLAPLVERGQVDDASMVGAQG